LTRMSQMSQMHRWMDSVTHHPTNCRCLSFHIIHH
jgi:hypothetical protein